MNPASQAALFAPEGRSPTASNALTQPLGLHLQRWLEGARAGEGHAASWAPIVHRWLHSPSGTALVTAVQARQQAGAVVYPAQVLHALTLTPLHAVRVLILGQDPYHGPGQAQGLAFSVPPGHPLPPSLRNVLREVERDVGAVSAQAARGDLSDWARQGVLLLNTSFTVEEGQAASHARLGWHSLTEALLTAVAEQAATRSRALAALLWGAHAQAHEPLLRSPHGSYPLLVLKANHPSPLAARRPPIPFVGCAHFSQARNFLMSQEPGLPPLIW